MSNEDMIKALTETGERAKANSRRIDELAISVTALNKMATALEVLATKQNAMAETVHLIDSKVTSLEAKPMKRLGTVVGYIAAAICSASAGAFLGFYF